MLHLNLYHEYTAFLKDPFPEFLWAAFSGYSSSHLFPGSLKPTLPLLDPHNLALNSACLTLFMTVPWW